MKKLYLVGALLLLLFNSAIAVEKTKIILIAGKDSHGDGAHEFRAGCNLLQKKLLAVMGDKLNVIVIEDDWPADTKVFEGAAATIIYSDGLKRHPLAKGKDRHEFIDSLTSKGMGIAFMHFACDVPPGKIGDYFRKWIGGHYETRWSTNPHWVCDSIYNSEHPITRGCNNFSLKDEWYFNMRFNKPESHKFVLKGKPSDDARSGKTSHPRGPYKHIVANSGRAETLLWTQERKDGGRGYGFTGGHFHKNWENDDYRKLILNAILWTAKLEVPAKGVETTTPTAEEMHFKTKKYMKENKK
jgi:type 1 glutamine amidotransferase